jgi:hypothetical protein
VSVEAPSPDSNLTSVSAVFGVTLSLARNQPVLRVSRGNLKSDGPAHWAWLFVPMFSLPFLGYSFVVASRLSSSKLMYHYFWLGYLPSLVTIGLLVLRSNVGRLERSLLLTALGLIQCLPRFFRFPYGPVFFDEWLHWDQADRARDTLTLLRPSALGQVLGFFPGLHALVGSAARSTGLSVWAIALMLLAVEKPITLLAVRRLARQVGAPDRVAGAAALVAAVVPAALFFNSMFAYQSLALPIMMWGLVEFERLSQSTSPRRLVIRFLTICAAVIVIHHITSYVMLIVCLLIFGVRMLLAPRPRRNVLLQLECLLLFVSFIALWTMLVARKIVAYIGPELPTAEKVKAIFGGNPTGASTGSVSEQRAGLFAGSTIPGYEKIVAVVWPLVIAAAILFCVRMLFVGRIAWRRLSPYILLTGLLAISFPLILTTSQETARRSWTFTYVGFAILFAFAWGRSRARHKTGLFLALGVVSAVGGTASDINENYRVPGSYVYGSDTRSLTTEVLAAAKWTDDSFPEDTPILAERYLATPIGAIAHARPLVSSSLFPFWEFYFDSKPTDRTEYILRYELDPVVFVDTQMFRKVPNQLVYFTKEEPAQKAPPSIRSYSRMKSDPTMSLLFSSTNLRAFRFLYVPLESDRVAKLNGAANGNRPIGEG